MINGVGTKARPYRKAERGKVILREGEVPLPHQLGVWGVL